MTETFTPIRGDVAVSLGEASDETDEYDSGWFCIHTDPYPCPAPSCGFVANYMTAAHLIVVWPSADDRDLFTQARNARDAGRNPRIVEYEHEFGKAIAWDVWVQLGCPVHAYAGHSGKDRYDRL